MEGVRVVEKYIDFTGRETLREVLISAVPDPDELERRPGR